MARERFAGDGEAADVGGGAYADAQLEEFRLAELGDKRAAFPVDVVSVRVRKVSGAPLIETVREVAVPLLEEGPVEMAHQSPLNSGRFFAANAS